MADVDVIDSLCFRITASEVRPRVLGVFWNGDLELHGHGVARGERLSGGNGGNGRFCPPLWNNNLDHRHPEGYLAAIVEPSGCSKGLPGDGERHSLFHAGKIRR